jgi:hypothetical protein
MDNLVTDNEEDELVEEDFNQNPFAQVLGSDPPPKLPVLVAS